MAGLTLYVPGPVPDGHRKITIATIDGEIVYTIPLLRAFGLDNLAMRWAIQDRPGRLPMTTPAGQNAVQPRLEVLIGSGLTESAENDVRFLRAFAIRGIPVVFGRLGRIGTHSGSSSWIVTEFALDQIELQQGSNEIAQAVATLTLVAALLPEQVQVLGK